MYLFLHRLATQRTQYPIQARIVLCTVQPSILWVVLHGAKALEVDVCYVLGALELGYCLEHFKGRVVIDGGGLQGVLEVG